ncbi:MAG: SPASM domain-containing protein [Deltaproteobacteria bacterium]|nr:SPASM domain-containing protein [Deltaproteobacteria bacterium]
MNPEKLINPLIVYWDITPDLSDDDIVLRICGELADTGIFVLDLRDMLPKQGGVTEQILKRLSKEQIKIKLTTDSSVLLQPVELLKSAQLFIEFDSVEQFRSRLGDLLDSIKKGYVTGVSFAFNSRNFMELPGFISLCIDNNIENIRIPIQRAYEREVFYPDQDKLSEALDKLDLEQLNLSIHDPFLWKMFYKKENPNEDGCNAAKTMMYISKDFEVTPCPIMPISMGNLRETSLKEIFSSMKRQDVRNKILLEPDECGACSLLDKCRGGCRGRTYVISGSLNKKDPACLSPHTQ